MNEKQVEIAGVKVTVDRAVPERMITALRENKGMLLAIPTYAVGVKAGACSCGACGHAMPADDKQDTVCGLMSCRVRSGMRWGNDKHACFKFKKK
jgi:hypothetical protein